MTKAHFSGTSNTAQIGPPAKHFSSPAFWLPWLRGHPGRLSTISTDWPARTPFGVAEFARSIPGKFELKIAKLNDQWSNIIVHNKILPFCRIGLWQTRRPSPPPDSRAFVWRIWRPLCLYIARPKCSGSSAHRFPAHPHPENKFDFYLFFLFFCSLYFKVHPSRFNTILFYSSTFNKSRMIFIVIESIYCVQILFDSLLFYLVPPAIGL